jgi:hypothetical protein
MTAVNDHCKQPSFFVVNDWGTAVYGRARSTWVISYLLRGDASQWYKTNKDTFTSWKIFINELKRAFTSSFHAELAFQKLELYSQGENQSVRNFFNEVLKLCKEADSTMSEATKLKNLLNKIKPSIQLEVRKKKPTSPTEFLEYARDVEELFQLSNINMDRNKNNNSTTSYSQSSFTRTNPPTSTNQYSNNSASTKSTSGYYRNNNNNGNNYNNSSYNRTDRSNYPLSTSSKPSFRLPQSSQNQTNASLRTNSNGRFQSQPNQRYSSNNTQSRARTAYTIVPADPSSDIELAEESCSDILCTNCNLYGHGVSSCQNFD